jgi:mono/diheme cytochrome c family protein
MLKSILRFFVFLLVLLCITGAIAYVIVRGHGFTSRATPGPLETRVARAARRWAIPDEDRKRTNPKPQDAASLKEGMEHFADHCALCHANDGSGNTEVGRGLYPKVPDLRLPATQSLTDGDLFYIIENGVPLTGMPAWGEGGGNDSHGSWNLVQFIRHLPQLTAAEKKAMEALNPKAPDDMDHDHEHEHHEDAHAHEKKG